MEVVLDSVTINHLLRKPKKVKDSRSSTVLDKSILKGNLRVSVDPKHAIIDEWIETCGAEPVKALVIKWTDARGLRTVNKVGKYGNAIANKLRQLGFDDTIDKLLVRVALVLKDRIIVSTDSDFWNPATPERTRSIGNRNAPVARLLREELAIRVYTLAMLVDKL